MSPAAYVSSIGSLLKRSTKNSVGSHGYTLVEMLIYTGLLSMILVVIYQLFALAGTQKAGEVVNDELFISAERIHADLQTNIKNAASIDTPILGTTASTLSLNGGSTVYAVDADGALLKTAGGETAPLTPAGVVVSALLFTHAGPSSQSPTILIEYTLEAVRAVQGSRRTETFRTGVTVR